MTPNPPQPRAPEAAVPDRDDPAATRVIATGDRRGEVHFEADPDQLVVARHEVRPQRPLPLEDPTGAAPAGADAPPVEDVRILPPGPSVWDARPPAEEAGKRGHSTDH